MKRMALATATVLLVNTCLLHAGEGEVPFDLVERAALSFSSQVFGETAVGPWEIYYGLDNLPAVYVFAFRLNGSGTLTEREINEQVARGHRQVKRAIELRDYELFRGGLQARMGEDRYGMIMVSARYEYGPVIEHYRAIPVHYVTKLEACETANRVMGVSDATFSRCMYYSPFDIWLEFLSREGKVYISPFNLRPYSEEEVFAAPLQRTGLSAAAERGWRRIERGDPSASPPLSQFRITGVPDFDWSYGCSPTASADVLGYWDDRFPLLIDYSFDRWDPVEMEMDYGVPNAQEQLASAMNTSPEGSTHIFHIAPGTQSVCNDVEWENEYNFYCYNYGDNHTLLVAEINACRPVHWVVIDHDVWP